MLERQSILVFYDSWCPICVKVKTNIKRLDWFNLIHFQSLREDTEFIGVSKKELEREMHCINKKNEVVKGIIAVEKIVARVPSLFVFYIPIKISIHMKIGGRLYNWIANKRKIMPVNNCCKESCKAFAKGK